MLKSAVPMSNTGNPQKRTTYLISLTLVKVEAVPEDGEEDQEQKEHLPGGEGSPRKKEQQEEQLEEQQGEAYNVPEKDGGSVCPPVVEKPSAHVEEVEQVQVKHGSPSESKGKSEKRESPAQHRDITLLAKSKDTSFVHPPVRQMVKVYGGSSTEGPVHREGPRSEALRPKTELYREPPMLYLKGENGADLSSRTRSSLPFSISSQVSQRPEVLMRPQAGANSCWRDLRETNTNQYHSAKTLDRRDNRMGDQSPLMAATTLGPYRASWADSEGRGMLIRPGAPMSGGYSGIMARESPQGERYKAVSVALPAPPSTDASRPQKKGTSRTLDNSDLHTFSEDLKKGKDGTMQRAPPRDRKMLKFISGIFTKSTPSAAPPLYPPVERGSSEEEGECHAHTLIHSG